jgi:hypothetical protein
MSFNLWMGVRQMIAAVSSVLSLVTSIGVSPGGGEVSAVDDVRRAVDGHVSRDRADRDLEALLFVLAGASNPAAAGVFPTQVDQAGLTIL